MFLVIFLKLRFKHSIFCFQEQYNIDHSHLDHPEECMEDPFQEAIDMFIKIFMNRFAIDDQLP